MLADDEEISAKRKQPPSKPTYATEDSAETKEPASASTANLPKKNAPTNTISNLAQETNKHATEVPSLQVEEDSVCNNVTIDPEDATEDSAPKKGRTRPKICKHEGCTNQVQNGGVCRRHGAKLTQYKCTHVGCTNYAHNGRDRLCDSHRHGGKRKKYKYARRICVQNSEKEFDASTDNISNDVQEKNKQAEEPPLLQTEGSSANIKMLVDDEAISTKRKQPPSAPMYATEVSVPRRWIYICKHKGCTSQVRNGGVCITHGAKPTICTYIGCTKSSNKGGLCFRHGVKVYCSHTGCRYLAQKGGVCVRHGERRPPRIYKICSHKGCTSQGQRKGLCNKHAILKGTYKICSHEGCTFQGQRKGGLCSKHAQYKRKKP